MIPRKLLFDLRRRLAQQPAAVLLARYLDLFVDALMLRRLEPFYANVGKRLVKSPKVYVRDRGILHALLGIATVEDLSAHPVAGHSWEGFVIEQIVATAPPLADFAFYRTAAGAELDLVVTVGGRSVGYEVKLSNAQVLACMRRRWRRARVRGRAGSRPLFARRQRRGGIPAEAPGARLIDAPKIACESPPEALWASGCAIAC